MTTRPYLAPSDPPSSATSLRRLSFTRPIVILASLALWAAILVCAALLAS